MSELGHELPFTVTRNQVCNAPINRHSGPNLGNVLDNLPPMNDRTCQGAAVRLSWRSVSGGIVQIKETRPNGECQVILIEEVP